MRSYRSCVLLALLTVLLEGNLSEQRTLKRRHAEDVSNNKIAILSSSEDESNHTSHKVYLSNPFILLMSSKTISVAQLPMIENGNLTDVYNLQISEDEYNLYEGLDGYEDGIEQEEAESQDDERPKKEGDHGADARQDERQMPKSAIVNTSDATTSLGKSEWQQIASVASSPSAVRDREEVWPQSPTKPSVGTDRKEDSQRGEAEEKNEPRRRRSTLVRARRSNSSSHEDAGVGHDVANGPPSNQGGADIRVGRAEESSGSRMQNVTSARSAGGSYNEAAAERGQRPASKGTVAVRGPAEDENGNPDDRSRDTHNIATASSFPGSSSGTSQQTANTAPNVQFCSFDVHMSLGYAFAADSTGRIHRFRLPTISQRNSDRGAKIVQQKKAASGESAEKAGTAENDFTNSIDAEPKFAPFASASDESKLHRRRELNVTVDKERDSNSAVMEVKNDSNHDDGRTETTGNTLADSSEANELNGYNPDDATLEQLRTIGRQHPTSSPVQAMSASERAVSVAAAPTSDTPAILSPEQSHFKASSEANTGSKLIWSRGKLSALNSANRAKLKRLKSSERQLQQQLALGEGASQLDKGPRLHQVVDGTPAEQQEGGGTKITTQSSSASERRAESASTQQKGESNESPFSADQRNRRLKRRPVDTKIVVDWLSNLLFVLDKYRLFVVDFDGNNELVLIDDFDEITRPVDVKLDPVNSFLFWLQAGRFHNTIYKLDLNVLSMPSATQRLIGNTLKLRQSGPRLLDSTNSSYKKNGDDQETVLNNQLAHDVNLVALVSRHYAHPIITNLPRQTKHFTVDHKNSRIYVPVVQTASQEKSTGTGVDGKSNDEQLKQDDAEVFAQTDGAMTHLNNTEIEQILSSDNCSSPTVQRVDARGQILAFNLDGTDVGALRVTGKDSHISSLEDIQDFTLDAKNGLLYWLTNGGQELFEEYKEGSTIHPAQHNLDGRNFLKLIHFDADGFNQPNSKAPRFNMRKIIQLLASSLSPNRWTRSDGYDQYEDSVKASGLKFGQKFGLDADSTRFSRNAPYIILGVTCLVVIAFFLIYNLIFHQISSSNVVSRRDDSLDSGSIRGISADERDATLGGCDPFLSPRWPQPGPSNRSVDTSTFNRAPTSTDGHLGSYDLESSNYDTSNAIDEHYRDDTIHGNYCDTTAYSFDPRSSKLADIRSWPTRTMDVFNKLYVPVELLRDETLSSIRRISLDQLEIERKAPLGEGHFGTVLQGKIRCHTEERSCRASGSQSHANRDQITRLMLPFASTSGSSGHGSSSSTSGEFITANTGTDANDDYLTPRNQLDTPENDYSIDSLSKIEEDKACVASDEAEAKEVKRSQIRVAIKRLKENASLDEKRDFLQEAKLLANFDHPNIVHLIGICLDRGSTLIVMEMMLGGDLIRYMQENTPKSAVGNPDELNYDDLLKICLDIVNGCCYLEELDYIHRDLAARNCLVSSRKREERVVKLADFGLARDIYKDSYYKKLNDSAMPLKWMAPECLIEQKFTKKSDVWSFGVVMWEVMNFCQQKPYNGVEPFFMKEHLASGARLARPLGCDDDLYKLMSQCWQFEPDRRPSFNECRAILIEIRNNASTAQPM